MSQSSSSPRRVSVAPLVPGARALPRANDLFSRDGSSLGNHRSGVQVREQLDVGDVLGQIITPAISLKAAIGLVMGTKGASGGRLLFGEGVWQFNQGLEIACPKLEIVALYPGSTIFRRSVAAASGDSLLRLTAQRVKIHGIRFEEPLNTSEVTIKISANKCVVDRCEMSQVYGAVELASADYCRVTDNIVDTYTLASPIFLSGTSSFNTLSDNTLV